jgi:uncharacterized protein (DUF1499 family)
MKKLFVLLFFLIACSSATDVPESSHIENTDVINYRSEISQHHDQIQKCFSGQFQEDEIIQLTMILLIAPSGEVTKKQFKTNRELKSSIKNCLSAVVDDMDFSPPQRKGTIEITYTSKIKVLVR